MGASPTARTALTAFATVGTIGAGAAIWGIGVERYLFTVRRHSLRVLPRGSSPIRVLHLSDIHMAPWQHRKQHWIASLTALRPDLIINTGDNLGHAEGLDGLRTAFEGFRGIPGFYVHGSNDSTAPSPRNPLRYFTGPSKKKPHVESLDVASLDQYLSDDLSWSDLDNATATLELNGFRIDGIGTGDAHHGSDRLDLLPGLAAEQRASGAGDLSLAVTHAPYRRVLNALVDVGADAIFAGHTHGGQVRLPGLGALVANCDLPLRQARGLSTWSHSGRTVPLNVSAGVGHSIYAPVRFACRPEVSLIMLLPRA